MERKAVNNLSKLQGDQLQDIDHLLTTYRVFRLTYRSDPVAFVHDCFRWESGQAPAPYQDEILATLSLQRRVAVRGPHGLGKTALAAWIVLWFGLTRDEDFDWKAAMTASAWRQLTKFLLPEIRKWAHKLRWEKIHRSPFSIEELLTLNIKLKSGEAFAVASDNPDMIEGAHAEHLLYVFDEAKAIPNETFDAAEGAFSVGDCYALAISTPGDRAGRFYDIHRRAIGFEDWWVRHITIDEAIAAGRVSPEWVEARKRQWGEQSPIYQARVLGEFPEQSEDTLISLSWIEAARERELRPLGDVIAGLDVARFGDDSSCLLARQGDCVLSADIWSGHDTMQTTGKAKVSGAHVNVDEIGVGAGVADRLRELNYPHTAINVGNAARDADKFINLRTELYWLMRERFQDRRIDLTRLSREVYDQLSGELTSMRYKYQSDGRLKLEEKAEMKKRIGHSPDVADALVLAFAGEQQEAVIEMIRAHEYTINERTF